MSSTTKQGISLNQTMSLLSQYLVLVYTTVVKQWIAFSPRFDWLLKHGISSAIHL